MSKISIDVVAVPNSPLDPRKLNTEQMRRAIQEEVQVWVDSGHTLRAMGSRGGVMYLVFAQKVRG
jgi:hypothetical protein